MSTLTRIWVSAGVLSLASGSSISAAQSSPPRSISTEGECKVSVPADRGSIRLSVEYLEMDPKEAASQTARTHERLVEKIKRLKLADSQIQSTHYRVEEVREWQKDKNVFRGYQVSLGLAVTTSDIKRLGEVIALASDEKLKNVGSLQTFLSDERTSELKLQCLKTASEHARKKAEQIATGLGVKLGEVERALEPRTVPPAPNPVRYDYDAMPMLAKATSAPSPQIEASEISIETLVHVTFQMK